MQIYTATPLECCLQQRDHAQALHLSFQNFVKLECESVLQLRCLSGLYSVISSTLEKLLVVMKKYSTPSTTTVSSKQTQ